MIATRASTPMTTPVLPQAVDAFVGSALELVIHSVETLRDRVMRAAMRHTRR